MGLLQVVIGREPIHLDLQTTAEALTFLSPLWSTTIPARAKELMTIIKRDPAVHSLEQQIARVSREGLAVSDSRFAAYYQSALTSVANSIVAQARHQRATIPADNGAPARGTKTAEVQSQRGNSERSMYLTSATQCSSQQSGIFPVFDETRVTVDPTSCAMTLETTGDASQGPLWLSSATTDWLWTATRLVPVAASASAAGLAPPPLSSADVQADTTKMCSVYSGEGTSLLNAIPVVPGPSVYDWLVNWVDAAISAAFEAVFQAGGLNQASITPSQNSLYIYRAFSGGGEETGPGTLNPYWTNNSCLTSVSRGLPGGNEYANDALTLNILTTSLDAVAPIVDLAGLGKHPPCLTEGLKSVLTLIRSDLNPTSSDVLSVAVQALVHAVPELLKSLTTCVYSDQVSQATSGWLQMVFDQWGSDAARVADRAVVEAQLVTALGLSALKLINLAEYSHPVESGFVIFGNPFASSGSNAPPPPTTTTTTTPTIHSPTVPTTNPPTSGSAGVSLGQYMINNVVLANQLGGGSKLKSQIVGLLQTLLGPPTNVNATICSGQASVSVAKWGDLSLVFSGPIDQDGAFLELYFNYGGWDVIQSSGISAPPPPVGAVLNPVVNAPGGATIGESVAQVEAADPHAKPAPTGYGGQPAWLADGGIIFIIQSSTGVVNHIEPTDRISSLWESSFNC